MFPISYSRCQVYRARITDQRRWKKRQTQILDKSLTASANFTDLSLQITPYKEDGKETNSDSRHKTDLRVSFDKKVKSENGPLPFCT